MFAVMEWIVTGKIIKNDGCADVLAQPFVL